MFLMMVLYYCDLFFGLYPPIEASSIDWTHRVGSPDDEGRAIPWNVVDKKHKDNG
jgi:hypothetical protein